jgi:hypothetical protein
MTEPLFSIEDIARIIHEANRAVQLVHGDLAMSPPWDAAPESQRQACREGVADALAGSTPEESHADWCAHLRGQGWTYGTTKDEELRTHPCLVPFEQLDPYQQAKSRLFVAIVRALRPNGEDRPHDDIERALR